MPDLEEQMLAPGLYRPQRSRDVVSVSWPESNSPTGADWVNDRINQSFLLERTLVDRGIRGLERAGRKMKLDLRRHWGVFIVEPWIGGCATPKSLLTTVSTSGLPRNSFDPPLASGSRSDQSEPHLSHLSFSLIGSHTAPNMTQYLHWANALPDQRVRHGKSPMARR
ncbi:hypothetical protein CIHG_10211 [Coccidioides immitis H538.4]|uniref:Uncharacterized protein n=3 Tax=Coccidioides immitis TaxID=5501 RepID=A0A0J8QNK2_COCIT|nr:hypothetical protein CIRG_02463 [Coccidioides immitis RMSCC 2394]KMU74031.1 hypothetical protein CISG_10249 [Coccidioides immitis RMSCC 3703]KMU92390.1 hypothetical protein CIHG_10211 [Coccidioides immitis H538.4]